MILLPVLFEETLRTNGQLHADVRRSLDQFEPWLEQSGMPFFPGFTDHSPRHINDVLATAASLLSDQTRELLSAEDVAVLTLAILLHDCGMHLTHDGFRALVSRNSPPLISGLRDKPWHQIWTEFLAEASRFSEERLLAVFGDSEPIDVKGLDIGNLTERDCLLVGEFVRRHHARLAHEIAVNCVPTSGTSELRLVGLDQELRDLAGLVARSHWMDIRDSFPYLQSKFGRIAEYRKVKSPFLMAVLRIADYVQVQSERALKTLLSVKELRSPLSRQEWRNHFAVRDVTTRHEDPEAMYVHAVPTDVKTFLRLDRLFGDIQKELDRSWAVIGEVYGRLGELTDLGLTVRRIRSNLDDRETFAGTVPYVPVKAGFQSSGPELLKLLVGPLYDYQHSVGIRELVQNAVDACRERADLVGEVPGEVVVEISEDESGHGTVSVRDTGVGMTLDTVVNYFLVAGASFRNSDLWKKQHTDDAGRSRVLRGGRFGVGALAAFLLGDEIAVETRSVYADEQGGFSFTARIDEPVCEIRRLPNAAVGTCISVKVKDPAVMRFLRPGFYGVSSAALKEGRIVLERWPEVDWFAQQSPRVIYRWRGPMGMARGDAPMDEVIEATFTPHDHLVPEEPTDEWPALDSETVYKRILWQYPPMTKVRRGDDEYLVQSPSHIVVNGIRVETLKRDVIRGGKDVDASIPGVTLFRPSVAIFDPAGICPINLQRSSVAFDRMGIDRSLAGAMLERFFAQSLKEVPRPLTVQGLRDWSELLITHDFVRFQTDLQSPLIATRQGLCLASPSSVAALGLEKLYIADAVEFEELPLEQLLSEGEGLLISVRRASGEQERLSWFRGLLASPDEFWRGRSAGFPPLAQLGALALLHKSTWGLARTERKVSKSLLSEIEELEIHDPFVLLRSGQPDSRGEQRERLHEVRNLIAENGNLGFWLLDPSATAAIDVKKSVLAEAWERTVGGPVFQP